MQRLVDTASIETPSANAGRSPSSQEDLDREANKRNVPEYALLYFDHLYSEFLALKPAIADERVVQLLEEINQKRKEQGLTWSEIYTFDLALVDARPLENLIRKAYDARAKYRSIAGQKEYDEYVASKPPDLTAIQIPPDVQPPEPGVIIERMLRADIKYLLNKFYVYYALLPVREGLRDQLTTWAVIITVVCVLLVVIAILINLGLGAALFADNVSTWLNVSAVFSLTVATVTLAGILGGCVSMLQRIQSAPTEGDAIANLAALNNGWRGLFLSPLYGGIFASLLFVLFAAGILSGSVFPVINTPKSISSKQPSPSANKSAKAEVPAATKAAETAAGQSAAVLQGSAQSTAAATPQGSTPSTVGTPVPTTSPAVVTPEKPTSQETAAADKAAVPEKSDILQIKDFINETGPANGVSFALLIIWSFIAGFAERLVPDTLNRLVAKNEAQGN
jgi:hypothetical protein